MIESAESKALCRERKGVPRLLFYLAGRRPANRAVIECQPFHCQPFHLSAELYVYIILAI